MEIDVIFENETLIAINKPHGLLVHKSSIAKDATEFALQLVRNYVGQRVFLAHRLDRKTSGVLLLTKTKAANSTIQKLFADRKVKKTYKAIVRGHIQSEGLIDYPLSHEDKTQEAQTAYTCIKHFEIDLPSSKHPTSRYSLIECQPTTGRFHQIRKHMAHIRHPIIGDRPHGCNKQNKLWKEKLNMTTMLLHAERLVLPMADGTSLEFKAPLSESFVEALEILGQN